MTRWSSRIYLFHRVCNVDRHDKWANEDELVKRDAKGPKHGDVRSHAQKGTVLTRGYAVALEPAELSGSKYIDAQIDR